MFGYKVSVDGRCDLECRHGGKCFSRAATSCSCPAKWGWQGALCADDIDECSLDPASATALNRVPRVTGAPGATVSNGGCGGGYDARANCTNSPGSWACSCAAGYEGAETYGAPNTCSDINECAVGKGGCQVIRAWPGLPPVALLQPLYPVVRPVHFDLRS